MIIRLSPDFLKAATWHRDGLGTTGTVFAVAADGMARSPVFRGPGRSVDEAVPYATPSSRSGSLPRSAEWFSETVPFDAMGVPWTIVAEQRTVEAFESVTYLEQALLTAMLVVVAFTGFLGLLVAGWIVMPIAALTVALNRLAGREMLFSIPGHDRRDEIGEIARAVATIRDMTAIDMRNLKAMSEDSLRVANTDALTGLSNRRRFLSELNAQIGAMRPVGKEACLGIIDLDAFKPINDLYGHAAGDKVLVEVGVRLSAALPHDAIVARLGGDEFAFIAYGIANPTMAHALGETVFGCFRVPVTVASKLMPISASIGLALFSVPGERAEDLMERADRALYEAKADRRGSFIVADTTVATIPVERAA